ncbi:MAG TPA: hypothetical protein PLP61_12380, partial [Nocardioides sp.]|uniref:hypothetical protein n=1 Tax=Nocardioides sp. TaxID=35761 RepID=UPI002C2C3CB1
PVTRVAWRPPLVPARLQPATLVGQVAALGRVQRAVAVRRLGELLDLWAPLLAEEVVRRLDLTDLVRRHVRLDEVVASVDLDAAVARVDLEAVVDRLDLDGIVATVDLDGAVARVDLDAILGRLDLDAIVATVNIPAIVDRLDLDAVVATVDLDGAVARVDLDAIIARIDLAGLAQEVIDEIDLPAIIRESTGSMASETVRGVRMTSISADDAISRVVDRYRLRRSRVQLKSEEPE